MAGVVLRPFGQGQAEGLPALRYVEQEARSVAALYGSEALVGSAATETAFVQRATGRTLAMRLVNFLRVVDGKIIEFREFSDTFDAVEQAVGAPLIVPAIAV